MALVLADRVREQSTTSGTGTFSLSGAVTGYQTFSSAIGNGNTCYYTISNPGTTEWEVGIGTVSAGQLARTTILSSSNAGSAVNFSSGTKDVFVTYPSQKAVYLDASGNLTPGALTLTSLVVSGTTNLNGGVTLGDASGDALTINSSAVSIPNGLNFDSNTLVIDATNNRTYIGASSLGLTTTASVPLFMVGQMLAGASNTTLNTTKDFRIAAGAYTNNAATIINFSGQSGTNSINYGGSTGAGEPATSHIWYTGTAGTLGAGSERMRVDSSGNLLINTASVPVTSSVTSNLCVVSQSMIGTSATGANVNKDFRILAGAYSGNAATLITFDGISGNNNIAYGGNTGGGEPATIHQFFTGTAGTAGAGSERMRITSTGNVGIGTSSPDEVLTVLGNIHADGSGSGSGTYGPFVEIGRSNGPRLQATQEGADNDIQGLAFFTKNSSVTADNPTERMRLDSSGNLGLGVTPSAWTSGKALEVNAVGNGVWSGFGNTYLTGNYYFGTTNKFADTGYALQYLLVPSNGSHQWVTSTASGTAGNTATLSTKMTLDASGNLGLGVTPSAWSNTSVFEIGTAGNAIWSYAGGGLRLIQNARYNAGSWIYTSTAASSRYEQNAGSHAWYNAASGTAGNAISFTQAMTLDASGNLGIGTTSPSAKLDVNGTIYSRTGGIFSDTFSAYNGTSVSINAGSSFFATSVNGSERMRIDSSGNVGIGNTGPGTKLDVSGTIRSLVSGGTPIVYLSNGTTQHSIQNTSGAFTFFVDGTERMRLDSAGNALFTNAVRATVNTNNTLTFNMNNASNFKCTPTAGGALTFTNITSGQTGNIILVNGSNYAITAAATTKVSATCLATISATGTYWLSYISDGTNVYVANTGALA